MGGGGAEYHLMILFADKNIIEFRASKKQFDAVEKYNVVDITTKGYYLASIKKQGTQNVIINKLIGVKESDLSTATPMKLDNKDTTKYDKWVVEEKKIAERKAKKAKR